ncbi:MAG: extracellular solute-binding protein, partial [Methylococcales bacterium]|nr:extracellular solute-binding protein [Methylococcales bacterium]
MLNYVLALLLIWFPCFLFAAPKDIIFWHSMAGQLGEEVARLTQQFNNSQTEYRVKPIYKGDYAESLTSFAAAFRAKHPPQLIQVFEVGTSVMRSPAGIVKPVDVLMAEQGMSLPKTQFFSAVLDRYSDKGVLLAMPFNISVPVLFYNADALAKLGVSSQSFPRTWDALEVLAKRLHDAGFSCAYTTAYPGWILIESYLALHGQRMIKGDVVIGHNE